MAPLHRFVQLASVFAVIVLLKVAQGQVQGQGQTDLAVGATCSIQNDTCTAGAVCDTGVCKENCTTSRDCPLDAECRQRNPPSVCECAERFYRKGSQCLAKRPLHHPCNQSGPDDQCIEHAECRQTPYESSTTCQCQTDYYRSGARCIPRIDAGLPCVQTSEDNPCRNGSVCSYGRCRCSEEGQHFNISTGQCEGRDYTFCNGSISCDLHGSCDQEQCSCEEDYFSIGDLCKPRMPGNSRYCHNTTMQCVVNATCTAGHQCECIDNHYFSGYNCDPRLPLDHICVSGQDPDPCLKHGECMNGRCQCIPQAFDERGVCHLTKNFNETCDMGITNPRQCGNNTKCVFRDIDPEPKCACDYDKFYNGEMCERRVLAAHACRPNHNFHNGEGDRQCVDNASCSSSTHVCECDDSHFYRNGYCARRYREGERCDPWSNMIEQCESQLVCITGRCSNRTEAGELCPRNSTVNPCIDGAVCSNGRCRCAGVGMRSNEDGECVPGVGDVFCNDTISCDTNAKCNIADNRCECDEDYAFVGELCEQRALTGEACNNDMDCVENANCLATSASGMSTGKTCACNTTTSYEDDHMRCRPWIAAGGPCPKNASINLCVDGAVCSNGRCRCESVGMRSSKDGECIAGGGDLFCNDTISCSTNATCNKIANRCECYEDYIFVGEMCKQRVHVGDNCDGSMNFCTVNAECLNGTCQCSNGHYHQDLRCAPSKHYGDNCYIHNDADSQCSSGTQCLVDAVDSEARCLCNVTRYFNRSAGSGGQCVPRIVAGESCPLNTGVDPCIDGAVCSNGRCRCFSPGMHSNKDGECASGMSEVFCNETFSCDTHASCNTDDNQCECEGNYIFVGELCKERLHIGATCDNSMNLCIANGECLNGICQCSSGYFHQDLRCIPSKHYGDNCYIHNDADNQCSSGTQCLVDTVDSEARCLCNVTRYFNSAAGSGGLCVPRLSVGVKCNESLGWNPCTSNAHCRGGQCECDYGFELSVTNISTICIDHGLQSDERGNEDTQLYSAIAGGTLGVLAIIVAILTLVAVRLHRLKKKKSFQNLTRNSSGSSLSSASNSYVEEWLSTRVAIVNYEQYLNFMYEHSAVRLAEQFERLRFTFDEKFTTRVAMSDANLHKNRYITALPYDHTRVQAFDITGKTKIYVNANYVQGVWGPEEYIATQAPLPSTTADFWQMVFEQRSGVVVMLADLVEDGRVKVDRYWPERVNTPVRHGDVVVQLSSEDTEDSFIVRHLNLSEVLHEPLHVTQICLPGWWKDGVSIGPTELLDFVKVVRKTAATCGGPITVHCSGGVGRTGMFIAADILTRTVQAYHAQTEVDLFSLVQTLMTCRPGIIQSKEQYIFLHEVVRVLVQRTLRSMLRYSSVQSSVNSNESELTTF